MHSADRVSGEVDRAGRLDAVHFTFIDIEDPGEFHAFEAGFVAAYYVDGEFIRDLGVEGAIRAEARYQGDLYGALDKEFFEVEGLHL